MREVNSREVIDRLVVDYQKQLGIMQFDYELQIRALNSELSLANRDLEEADKLISDLSSELSRAVEEVKRLREVIGGENSEK